MSKYSTAELEQMRIEKENERILKVGDTVRIRDVHDGEKVVEKVISRISWYSFYDESPSIHIVLRSKNEKC